MSKLSKTSKQAILSTIYFAVAWLVVYMLMSYFMKPSSLVSYSQGKEAFVSGCITQVESAGGFIGHEEDVCSCSWDKLYEIWGDQLLNDSSISGRITSEGFSSYEIKEISSCAVPYSI